MISLRRFRTWLRRDRFEAIQPWSARAAKLLDPLFTANRMTLLGLVMCLPATFCFVYGAIGAGAVFMILSLFTDLFDGAIARYQEETYRAAQGLVPLSLEEETQFSILQRVEHRGVTHFGRSLDPLVDKIRTGLFLLTVGWTLIAPWIIWSIIGVAVVLTCMRPIKQWLKLDHAGSNRFGKYKIFAEVAGMATWLLLHTWVEFTTYTRLMELCFLLALALGLASLLGHVITGYVAHRKGVRIARTNALRARPSSLL